MTAVARGTVERGHRDERFRAGVGRRMKEWSEALRVSGSWSGSVRAIGVRTEEVRGSKDTKTEV